MWKSPGISRKKLEKKLVNRWSTENPTVVELGQTREPVSSIFCKGGVKNLLYTFTPKILCYGPL